MATISGRGVSPSNAVVSLGCEVIFIYIFFNCSTALRHISTKDFHNISKNAFLKNIAWILAYKTWRESKCPTNRLSNFHFEIF